ncbi:MAG: glycosyltransferase family 2 protein [Candidatus Lokiarchaeia archaeon]
MAMLDYKEKSVNIMKVKNEIFEKQDYSFNNHKIAILVPAYNESKNIGKVLSQISSQITKQLKIIVIDDGSTDNTGNIAESYGAKVIRHQENKGYGAAVRTGLKSIKKNNFDIAVILDSDGQHNPKDIPKLIEPLVKNEVDFVFGNRFFYKHFMPPLKLLCSKIISAVYLVFIRKLIFDPTNGYRAMTSKVFKNLNLESDYSISQEMLLKILPFYKYKQVPIYVPPRENGDSFIRLKHYFYKMIFMVFKYYFFPKIKGLTDLLFSEKTRRKVSFYCLKT